MWSNASFLCCREGAPHSLMEVGEKFLKLFTSSPRTRGFTAIANNPPSVLQLIRTKALHWQAICPKVANPKKQKASPFTLHCWKRWSSRSSAVPGCSSSPPLRGSYSRCHQPGTLPSKSSLHQQTLKCLSPNKSSHIINQGWHQHGDCISKWGLNVITCD